MDDNDDNDDDGDYNNDNDDGDDYNDNDDGGDYTPVPAHPACQTWYLDDNPIRPGGGQICPQTFFLKIHIGKTV